LALQEDLKVPVLAFKTEVVGYVLTPAHIELRAPEEYKVLVSEAFPYVKVE
jgi:hypothetical protein